MTDTFANRLHSLVTTEVRKVGVHDSEAMAGMVEDLASTLAFTVALAAKGDPKRIDVLFTGMSDYLCVVASERAPMARMAAMAKSVGNA